MHRKPLAALGAVALIGGLALLGASHPAHAASPTEAQVIAANGASDTLNANGTYTLHPPSTPETPAAAKAAAALAGPLDTLHCSGADDTIDLTTSMYVDGTIYDGTLPQPVYFVTEGPSHLGYMPIQVCHDLNTNQYVIHPYDTSVNCTWLGVSYAPCWWGPQQTENDWINNIASGPGPNEQIDLVCVNGGPNTQLYYDEAATWVNANFSTFIGATALEGAGNFSGNNIPDTFDIAHICQP